MYRSTADRCTAERLYRCTEVQLTELQLTDVQLTDCTADRRTADTLYSCTHTPVIRLVSSQEECWFLLLAVHPSSHPTLTINSHTLFLLSNWWPNCIHQLYTANASIPKELSFINIGFSHKGVKSLIIDNIFCVKKDEVFTQQLSNFCDTRFTSSSTDYLYWQTKWKVKKTKQPSGNCCRRIFRHSFVYIDSLPHMWRSS